MEGLYSSGIMASFDVKVSLVWSAQGFIDYFRRGFRSCLESLIPLSSASLIWSIESPDREVPLISSGADVEVSRVQIERVH